MGRAATVVLVLLGASMAMAVPAGAEEPCSFTVGDEGRGVQTCDGQGKQVRLWANGQTIGVATLTYAYPGLYACETVLHGACIAAYLVADDDQRWACASPLVSICVLGDREGADTCYSLWFMGVRLPLERSCIDLTPSALDGARSMAGE